MSGLHASSHIREGMAEGCSGKNLVLLGSDTLCLPAECRRQGGVLTELCRCVSLMLMLGLKLEGLSQSVVVQSQCKARFITST